MTRLLAQEGIYNPALNPTVGLGTGSDSGPAILQLFLTNFIRLGFVVAAVVFFFMLIFGSIQYITAGGDKERTSSSTKRLTAAIVGLAILFSLYVILRLVKIIFGVDILLLEIPVIQ